MDDIRDIKGPVGLDKTAGWPGWLAGGLALTLGGLAIWRWRRGRTRDGLEEVRTGLAALTRKADRMDDRGFYYELAGLVSRALGARLGFAATALTSQEILARIADAGLPQMLVTDVIALLGRADPARYAEETTGEDRRAADLRTALALTRAGSGRRRA